MKIKLNFLLTIVLFIIYLIIIWNYSFNQEKTYNYEIDIGNKLTLYNSENKKYNTCLTSYVTDGDTISDLFLNSGANLKDLYNILDISSDNKKALSNIRVGEKLEFCLNDNKSLHKLSYYYNDLDTLVIINSGENSFASSITKKQYDYGISFASGEITESLFYDGKKANISDTTIMQLVDIFSWDIDFSLDLRQGDKFRILYERKLLDGHLISDGKILYAEFINNNKVYTAFFYNPEGKTNEGKHYSTAGRNMQKLFLRSPVKFTRISSHFNLRRKHPKLHIIRAHKGVDYAAPRRTPIKSTASGKIIFAGRKGGYGNVVIIKHGSKYTTLYAHLNSFSSIAKIGRSVSQGNIIGYVGSSGLATGPHLHYEFRVHGHHKNPLKIKLPKAVSLPKKYLARFKQHTKKLLKILELHDNRNLKGSI